MPSETIPTRASAVMTARIPRHVVYRGFVSETVVLNLDTGNYHGLNPTAGRMLEVLEKIPDVDQAAAKLAEEFGVGLDQVREDLIDLCGSLAERGLLELDRHSAN